MKVDLKKIEEMFLLQEELNVKVYDKNWYKNRTRQDLVRAIWTEAVELMNSLPWKWWAAPNLKNAQIETIDLWHFIMSYILLENDGSKNILKSHLTKQFLNGLDWENIDIKKFLNDLQVNFIQKEEDENKRILFCVEELVKHILHFQADIAIFFFGMIVNELLTFDRLYLFYIGKNVLNRIRNEKGYKSGKYRKYVEGKEDNDYLYELISQVNTGEELEKSIRTSFENLN